MKTPFKAMIYRDLVLPLARRAGTMAAAGLVGAATVAPPEAQVAEVANAVTVLVLVGWDLAMAKWSRK